MANCSREETFIHLYAGFSTRNERRAKRTRIVRYMLNERERKTIQKGKPGEVDVT